jgi:hypothetical protein
MPCTIEYTQFSGVPPDASFQSSVVPPNTFSQFSGVPPDASFQSSGVPPNAFSQFSAVPSGISLGASSQFSAVPPDASSQYPLQHTLQPPKNRYLAKSWQATMKNTRVISALAQLEIQRSTQRMNCAAHRGGNESIGSTRTYQ